MTEKFWDRFQTWEEAEAAWDTASKEAAVACPLKGVFDPSTPAIAPGEMGLRWKGLQWVVLKDKGFRLVRRLLHHPIRYAFHYLRSMIKRSPYRRAEDLFFYGIKSSEEMKELLRDDETILVVGFSYCQKPRECPCMRFSDACVHSLDNPVCCQCVIGKAMHSLPYRGTVPVIIPTINAIGTTILEVVDAFPNKRVAFVITACEMALRMFADMGNMVGVRGVGIRLGGRVCNTFRAFAISEDGVKPGLTMVLPSTQHSLFDLLRTWREAREHNDACPQGRQE
jgi:hypothetical protein